MQHLDDDIDLALDDPPTPRPGPVFWTAASLAALVAAAAFAASTAGRLTLESRTFPLVLAVVTILTAIAYAYRRPAN
ncbi:hypothetical protein DQE82_26670 [Micromonospora sp. LHW51205]|uniref:hypothetical protein n=1 Tax=Micromonospora sp. LHW51205 TaxID=2248752 RepID=UPI000DEAC149|nr:hypothetical protein [Micromonospora sp. LHW51205]RBQ05136.1 hypothetical protein DQE82_26670 [Micromonospora sp. LHW51205]